MASWFKHSQWSILILPVLFAKSCSGGSGGGGNGSGNVSPSASTMDWLFSSVAAYVPAGAVEMLHALPVIHWLV